MENPWLMITCRKKVEWAWDDFFFPVFPSAKSNPALYKTRNGGLRNLDIEFFTKFETAKMRSHLL